MKNIQFINNPNLKEKEKICTIDYVLGFNDLFMYTLQLIMKVKNNILSIQMKHLILIF